MYQSLNELAPDTTPAFASTALTDSAVDELAFAQGQRELATANDADDSERCEAMAMLGAALPGRAVTLSQHNNWHQVDGAWVESSNWFVCLPDADLGALDDHSPIRAAEQLIRKYRKATAPVRRTPEHRELTAESFEAFGVIDPVTAAAFLTLVAEHHGRSDFLRVEPDGRVMLASGEIEGSEAMTIGQYVAMHIAACTGNANDRQHKLNIEQRGDCFKVRVIAPSGERIEVPGVYTSHATAVLAGELVVLNQRPTVMPAKVASTNTHAA